MAVAWTKEQKKVIDLRDRNILVSAAAGSGKTAVLVERILTMVTDKENPVDIDSLLVVTFTRAAAAEMKERIRAALEKALTESPEDEHLQRQSALIHHAQITTIHGFCTYVIQNYFHLIDLDPGYRIADEGELKLLKKEVLEEVLEEAYEEKDPGFLKFVEWYAPGKSDQSIENLILKLYDFAVSYPYPKDWLDECNKMYESAGEGRLEDMPWMQELLEEIHTQLHNALEVTKNASALARSSAGPYMYLPMLEADEEILHTLLQKESYQEMYQALQGMGFMTLSRKKDTSVDETLRAQVKALRDDVKSILTDIQTKYCSRPKEQVVREFQLCREPIFWLVGLTKRFMEVFSEKKRRKSLMDFSDLEHFALEILVQKKNDGYVRTEAAKELSNRYAEVMIDEYQDSNFIQEFLLESVSGVFDGTYNRFMVGDVKQSIYGFRLARPELFLKKQEDYTVESSREQRIDLHKNFRSRKNVLTSINFMFRQIMERSLGGIEYDDSEALYAGADYPDGQDPDFPCTDVLLIDSKSPELEDTKTRETMIETEALFVSKKIISMVGKDKVWDKNLKTYRKVEYRDCVVLLRTVSEWADIFSRVLQSQGIPAYTTSQTGYFSALEVVTVLDFLRICDNPMQDIPFAAVLHSPIGTCSSEELAVIKSTYPSQRIYQACNLYAREGSDESLRGKLLRFLKMISDFRDRVPYTPIHQLVEEILEETGYGDYAAAMPAGQQRTANLAMLVEKAIEFEDTSYRGLFNFIRYIEEIQKYEVDFGEVNINGETEDTVRIMSIHKSKGLEFPVVFVAGMGKRFNFMDANQTVVLHSKLGIASDVIDSERRTKEATLLKEAVRQRMTKETLGEELRILYVALTRAKEKLILCGSGDLKKWVESCGYLIYSENRHLYYGRLIKARCYFDWVLASLAGHPCFQSLFEMYQLPTGREVSLEDKDAKIKIQVITPSSLVASEMLTRMNRDVKKQELLHWDASVIRDPDTKKILEKRFSYVYPYRELALIPVKMSVSELKRSGEDEQGEELFYESDQMPYIPEFMQEARDEKGGSARGTIYHKVFENLNYKSLKAVIENPFSELKRQLDAMVSDQKLSKEDAEHVWIRDLVQFLHTDIGQRICQAGAAQRLYREQPFVMGIPASDIDEKWPADELVLVQGIIDAYFEEQGKLVLVDYKTDRVTDPDGSDLAKRYEKQLLYYKKALQQITGKEVKEMDIYSVSLGRKIEIV